MSHLPPLDDAWLPARFTIAPDRTGTADIGGALWHVRAWGRSADGAIVCEMQPMGDAEFRALVDGIVLGEAG